MASSLVCRMAKLAQRVGAAMLLVFVLTPLVACLFDVSAAAQSSLPACCRTHGKHQCLQPLEQGTRVVSVHAKCPCMPGAVPSARHDDVSFRDVPAVFTVVIVQTNLRSSAPFVVRACQYGPTQKRGPPFVVLS